MVVVLFGPAWSCTILYGLVWSCMVQFGPVLFFRILYGFVHGLVWFMHGFHCSIWSCLDFVILYVLVISYIVLCGLV